MNNITLTDDQIKKLEAAILELPGKHAIPLLQLINGFIQENAPKASIPEIEIVEGP